MPAMTKVACSIVDILPTLATASYCSMLQAAELQFLLVSNISSGPTAVLNLRFSATWMQIQGLRTLSDTTHTFQRACTRKNSSRTSSTPEDFMQSSQPAFDKGMLTCWTSDPPDNLAIQVLSHGSSTTLSATFLGTTYLSTSALLSGAVVLPGESCVLHARIAFAAALGLLLPDVCRSPRRPITRGGASNITMFLHAVSLQPALRRRASSSLFSEVI